MDYMNKNGILYFKITKPFKENRNFPVKLLKSNFNEKENIDLKNSNKEDNFISSKSNLEKNEIFYHQRNNTKTAPINSVRQNFKNSNIFNSQCKILNVNQNPEKNFIGNSTNGIFYLFNLLK